MSAGALARNLNVPRTRIERLATEQIAVTPDTALRLAKFFRTTPEFWMNTQSSYDLKTEAVAIQDQLLAIRLYPEGENHGVQISLEFGRAAANAVLKLMYWCLNEE